MMPEVVQRDPDGKFLLVPISDATQGHRPHTLPVARSQFLETHVNRNPAERPNDDRHNRQKGVDGARRFTGVFR